MQIRPVYLLAFAALAPHLTMGLTCSSDPYESCTPLTGVEVPQGGSTLIRITCNGGITPAGGIDFGFITTGPVSAVSQAYYNPARKSDADDHDYLVVVTADRDAMVGKTFSTTYRIGYHGDSGEKVGTGAIDFVIGESVGEAPGGVSVSAERVEPDKPVDIQVRADGDLRVAWFEYGFKYPESAPSFRRPDVMSMVSYMLEPQDAVASKMLSITDYPSTSRSYHALVQDASGHVWIVGGVVEVAGTTQPLSVSLALSGSPSTERHAGDLVGLIATPSGGIAPYSYSWSSAPAGSIAVLPAGAMQMTIEETTTFTVTVTDAQGSTASAMFTVTVLAPPPTAMLQVNILSGAGTISSEPNGITCPGSCSSSFDEGQTVTLTASNFQGTAVFAGDCVAVEANSNKAVTTIAGSKTCNVTFIAGGSTMSSLVCTNAGDQCSGIGTVAANGRIPFYARGYCGPNSCPAFMAYPNIVTIEWSVTRELDNAVILTKRYSNMEPRDAPLSETEGTAMIACRGNGCVGSGTWEQRFDDVMTPNTHFRVEAVYTDDMGRVSQSTSATLTVE